MANADDAADGDLVYWECSRFLALGDDQRDPRDSVGQEAEAFARAAYALFLERLPAREHQRDHSSDLELHRCDCRRNR